MKINRITLFNFGSYEGLNSFDFSSKDQSKRVVIIGGKNGAGKTTLFTAIETCLYGNYAFGYKTAGKVYLKDIARLINNNARLDENASAYVEIEFEQSENTDTNTYTICRYWSWNGNNIFEEFRVTQNMIQLATDELTNFQNYLLHLIPPDMLKLYFFDGEQIADYFLRDQSINFRDAIMVLSGYDTFQILQENIKRLIKPAGQDGTDISSKYLELRDKYANAQANIIKLQEKIDTYQAEEIELTAEIEFENSSYQKKGGISLSEWKSLNSALRDQEIIREHLNSQRKQDATDLLPFMILRDRLDNILSQMKSEKMFNANKTLDTIIGQKDFADKIDGFLSGFSFSEVSSKRNQLLQLIRSYLLSDHWDQVSPILGLSGDDEALTVSLIKRIQGTDPVIFKNYQFQIDESLKQTKKIREELQTSDIEHFEEHINKIKDLEDKKSNLIFQIELLNKDILSLEGELDNLSNELKAARKVFEESIKKKSISAISGRVLLAIDELLEYIHTTLRENVEKDINEKLKELFRKKDYFTEVKIDDSYGVNILRKKSIAKDDLIAMIRNGNLDMVDSQLGKYASIELQNILNTNNPGLVSTLLAYDSRETYELPVIIEKNSLSSGEKQIFVMSLYWALMNQSKSELPYVIDTPFARIDTEHRNNIVNHFFKDLRGQLLILSTNEEISDQHLQAMSDQIAAIYTLDYGEDKKTHIKHNSYFEAGE